MHAILVALAKPYKATIYTHAIHYYTRSHFYAHHYTVSLPLLQPSADYRPHRLMIDGLYVEDPFTEYRRSSTYR